MLISILEKKKHRCLQESEMGVNKEQTLLHLIRRCFLGDCCIMAGGRSFGWRA